MSYANLVLQLREVASKGISAWGDLQREAANAIELLQEQLKSIKGQLNIEIYMAVSLRHRIRSHLANRNQYSHSEFCEKLEELIQFSVEPDSKDIALSAALVAVRKAMQGALDFDEAMSVYSQIKEVLPPTTLKDTHDTRTPKTS